MTAPSDFLELDRLADDGNPNHARIEEQWDEPEAPLCPICGESEVGGEDSICEACWNVWKEYTS